MKNALLISSLSALAVLSGCNQHHESTDRQTALDQAAADKYFVTSMADTAVKNGIIAQHALYPYHFTPDSAQLNPLGAKELAILSEHYKVNGGHLTLRQGDAPDELFQARTEIVIAELKRAGVADGKVAISGGFPGGAGMSSERINAALKEESKGQQQSSSYNSNATNAQPTPINPSQP